MPLRRIFAVMLVAAMSLAGEDFWKTRAPGQWSDKEIKQLVTHSPWAKQAIVRVRGKTSSSASPNEVLVRWDSAPPVIEACANGGMERHLFSCASKLLYLSGLGQKFDELRKFYYVVGVSNYPKPPRRDGDPPEHSEAANAALALMSRRIQDATFLKCKGRTPIRPSQVVSLPAADALLLIVFFPRADALSLEDEEVSFELADGPVALETRFDLRAMIFEGRLQL